MVDINNLTIVQSLALNTCWASYIYNNLDKPVYDFAYNYGLHVNKEGYKIVDNIIASKLLLLKNKNCWSFKKSFYNKCHKLAWPSVKLPGYTKQQAIAEFREVIEFVRRRYEKN